MTIKAAICCKYCGKLEVSHVEEKDGVGEMKAFMDDNFLLHNETAKWLYHDCAAEMPIIDYHCHLSQREIYENVTYANLTEVWLNGDHYKWRAMRANGIEEKYITGGQGVSDYDRFLAYARTVPMTLGNPLYHWSHLELRRLFGIEELINERNAPLIWEKANAKLQGGGFAVRDFIRGAGVEVLCTTDDPADSLEHHRLLAQEPDLGFRSFRPSVQTRHWKSTVRRSSAMWASSVRPCSAS